MMHQKSPTFDMHTWNVICKNVRGRDFTDPFMHVKSMHLFISKIKTIILPLFETYYKTANIEPKAIQH